MSRCWNPALIVALLGATGLVGGCHDGRLAGSGSDCGPEIPCRTFFTCVAGQCQWLTARDAGVDHDGDATDGSANHDEPDEHLLDLVNPGVMGSAAGAGDGPLNRVGGSGGDGGGEGNASPAGGVGGSGTGGSGTSGSGGGRSGAGGAATGESGGTATDGSPTGGSGSSTGGSDPSGSGDSGGSGTGGSSPDGGIPDRSRSGDSSSDGGGADVPIPDPCAHRPAGTACILGGIFPMGDGVIMGPIHEVTVSTFLMDVTEVTTGAYSACVSVGNCTLPSLNAPSCNYGVAGRGDQPINCVDWFQATAYCQSLGKRLPTEEEWEYAARGQEGREYPWGNGRLTASRLNLCGDECSGQMSTWGGDGYPQMAPVGSFPMGDTPEGLHDMAGNVWEMTSSHFCDYPSTPCTNCPGTTTCTNPCGGCADSTFVHRGNGWSDIWDWPESYIFKWRGYNPPDHAQTYIGFRCAR